MTYAFIFQPKGKGKKGKGKGKGKGKAKKESPIIDGVSTEEMTKEQASLNYIITTHQ